MLLWYFVAGTIDRTVDMLCLVLVALYYNVAVVPLVYAGAIVFSGALALDLLVPGADSVMFMCCLVPGVLLLLWCLNVSGAVDRELVVLSCVWFWCRSNLAGNGGIVRW